MRPHAFKACRILCSKGLQSFHGKNWTAQFDYQLVISQSYGHCSYFSYADNVYYIKYRLIFQSPAEQSTVSKLEPKYLQTMAKVRIMQQHHHEWGINSREVNWPCSWCVCVNQCVCLCVGECIRLMPALNSHFISGDLLIPWLIIKNIMVSEVWHSVSKTHVTVFKWPTSMKAVLRNKRWHQ